MHRLPWREVVASRARLRAWTGLRASPTRSRGAAGRLGDGLETQLVASAAAMAVGASKWRSPKGRCAAPCPSSWSVRAVVLTSVVPGRPGRVKGRRCGRPSQVKAPPQQIDGAHVL